MSPIQWVPGALPFGAKRPECEADHSSPCSTGVKNAWSNTYTYQIGVLGVVLKLKHRDKFNVIMMMMVMIVTTVISPFH
jgi:hypothetical protein